MFSLFGALGSGRKTRRTVGHRKGTSLRGFESLEPRRVLAAVADVNISSSNWSSNYISELENEGLGNDGYGVGNYETVPWSNVNEIAIQFTGNVSVDQSDLSVKGVNGNYGISGFSYNSSTKTAVWTLSGSIGADKVLIDLDGSVLGSGSSDFEMRFNVLPGDVNGNGSVNYTDYVLVDQVNGTDTGDSGYNPLRDLDGTGAINFGDLSTVIYNVGDSLPWGQPTSNDAPVITLHAEEGSDDMWVFYGTVQDNDPGDNPYGWTVDFYGLLAGRQATVGWGGNFELAVSLGSSVGTALAQTHDGGGLSSNVASYQV